MSNTDDCQLTTKDYTLLEAMLERHPGHDDPMREILRRKIDAARVVFRDDVEPAVVTLSSRVTYTVDDGSAETRIVASDAMRGMVGAVISISSPRGLALLGLAEGQSMTIPRADGGQETITVREVVYQPEQARREAESKTVEVETGTPRSRGSFLRLVHSADDVPASPKRASPSPFDGGPDDPGPSAA